MEFCPLVRRGPPQTMTSRKLRCAVIGTGTFAEVCHIPGLQSHPDAEVVAICGEQVRARRLASKFGVPSVHADVNEVCERDDIDALTIVTRNADHRAHALAAIRNGKHVLCEKPLGMNANEAREMAAAAALSRRIHQVAFVFRYTYGVRELRRRVLRGDIGQPYLLRVQYDNWDGLKPEWKAGWRDQLDSAGGGVMFDLGSHLFDLAHHVLGPIESGIGFTGVVPRTRPDGRSGRPIQVETDDFMNAWLHHKSGSRGQIAVSRVTPSFTQNGWLEVVGPDGALKAALSRGAVDSLKASTPTIPEWVDVPLALEASDGAPHALGLMMRSFVDACLRGHSDPDLDATFEDGAAVQYAMAAVLASEAQGRWVPLAEI